MEHSIRLRIQLIGVSDDTYLEVIEQVEIANPMQTLIHVPGYTEPFRIVGQQVDGDGVKRLLVKQGERYTAELREERVLFSALDMRMPALVQRPDMETFDVTKRIVFTVLR